MRPRPSVTPFSQYFGDGLLVALRGGSRAVGSTGTRYKRGAKGAKTLRGRKKTGLLLSKNLFPGFPLSLR